MRKAREHPSDNGSTTCHNRAARRRRAPHIESSHLRLDVVDDGLERCAITRLRLLAKVVEVHVHRDRHLGAQPSRERHGAQRSSRLAPASARRGGAHLAVRQALQKVGLSAAVLTQQAVASARSATKCRKPQVQGRKMQVTRTGRADAAERASRVPLVRAQQAPSHARRDARCARAT